MGVAAAQIARGSGVTVIGTGGDGKRELAESLGATFVNHHDVVDKVREILPDGVDAILDVTGATRAFRGAPGERTGRH